MWRLGNCVFVGFFVEWLMYFFECEIDVGVWVKRGGEIGWWWRGESWYLVLVRFVILINVIIEGSFCL